MKFRHTQTNVKRRDRQIATIIFAICELAFIFLFAYLGIARTSQVTDENATVISTEIDDIELVSADKYNDNQVTLRVCAITLFSLTEVFAIVGYVIYMIFHRTSKDKKWI